MTTHGESAVLVLAAGAGTRMRSDTPKVLHTLAGPQHAGAFAVRDRQDGAAHLVVVLGRDHQRIEEAVGELAENLGARSTSQHKISSWALVAPAVRPIGTARRFPRRRRRHVRRHPAARRRHAGRPGGQSQFARRGGHRVDHDAERSDRVRPHAAHPGQRGDRDRRAGWTRRRHSGKSAKSTPACTPSTSPRCDRR